MENLETTPIEGENNIVELPEKTEPTKTIEVDKRYTTFSHYTGQRNFDVVYEDKLADKEKRFLGICVEDGTAVFFTPSGLDEYKEAGGCHNALDISTERPSLKLLVDVDPEGVL